MKLNLFVTEMLERINHNCNQLKCLEKKKEHAKVVDLKAPEFQINIPLAYSRDDLESYQLWCSEYAQDILSNLMESEKYRRRVLLRSPQIEYRGYLIRLIQHAAEEEELGRITVHLAIYLLDVFMDNHSIRIDRLNIIALVCLLLAAKIEECELNIPKISSLNEVLKDPYKLHDFTVFEAAVLGFFKWNIMVATPAHIVETYMRKVVTEDEFDIYKRQCRKMRVAATYENYVEMLSGATDMVFEFIDFVVTDQRLAKMLPSKAAAACIAATRNTLNITPIWPEHFQKETKYKLDDLEETMKILLKFGNSYNGNETINIKSNLIKEIDSKSIDKVPNDPEDNIHTIPYKRRCLTVL